MRQRGAPFARPAPTVALGRLAYFGAVRTASFHYGSDAVISRRRIGGGCFVALVALALLECALASTMWVPLMPDPI